MKRVAAWCAGVALSGMMGMAWAADAAPAKSNAELVKEVTEVEKAFAATMKARDFAAFVDFLADDTVFGGVRRQQVGKDAVATQWKNFYKEPAAPFSWEPDSVIVLPSGTLAKSSGPVYSPDGKLISRFNSIWRREPSGKWKIVFDEGSSICACEQQKK
ncbi:YybH family protein [Zemynaea arenosa]|nr:nuclear transport factor 2 family protein [Massilia arenosa]